MIARITIDSVDSLLKNSKGQAFDKARVALLQIAKTANPTAKTAVNGAAFFANANAFADVLETLGNNDSVVCFYEIPEGKTDERKVAEYKLANFAARVRLAANAESVSGTIYADEKTAKESNTKEAQANDY